MGRMSNRHRGRTENPPTDWKESRIVIAALSIAGTATFMSTVVLPISTAALTAKLEALAPADEKIKRLEKELTENKVELAAEKTLVAEATLKTPFLPGSVYPVGLDKIRLGSTRQEVVEAYPNGKWVEDEYFSVETNNTIFGSVTYYFSGNKKNQRVSMILFHIGYKSPIHVEEIRNRFAVLFGQPSATGRHGLTFWKATPRETIEMDSNNGYLVKAGNYIPYWATR